MKRGCRMDYEIDGHYYDDLEPVQMLEELKGFLREYAPQVHTCREDGYSYLEEGDFCLTIKNSSGRELYLDLNEEFTLSYAAWHGHYSPCKGEYEMLKRDLEQLLNSCSYAFSVFIHERWMGSAALGLPLSSKVEVKEQIHIFLRRDRAWLQQAKKEGVEARLVYWDETKNRTVSFAPGEY